MESWLSVGDAEATCRLEAYRLALSVAQVGRGRGGDRTSRMGTPDTCSQAVGRLLLGFLSICVLGASEGPVGGFSRTVKLLFCWLDHGREYSEVAFELCRDPSEDNSQERVWLLLPCWLEAFRAEDKLSRLYQMASDGFHNPVNAESGQGPQWLGSPSFSHCLMP